MSPFQELVIGTAGHIDHGKTSLVRALTGVDTDRLPAEKARGITIDLGFAALDLGGRSIALVDVPGHERFIRNMLAGASGIDLALLVVAADDSVMPQTREHFEILKLLGLKTGIVAITKADLVAEDWLALVADEVRSLVAGSFLEGCPIVPTSSTTGLGIERIKLEIEALSRNLPPRNDSGLFRMPVDRAFTLSGHGTVVTGAVASGVISVGDGLILWPEGREVRVRGLHRHAKPVESAGRGARAAVNLVGVRHTEVERGHVLAAPGYLEPAHRLTVTLRASADAPRPLRSRTRYRIHLGTQELTGRVVFLDDETPNERERFAQIVLAERAVAVHGQPFVVREESPPATLGGGVVLQPNAKKFKRKDSHRVAFLQRLASVSGDVRLEAALEARGVRPGLPEALTRDSGVPIREIPAALERLASSGRLIDLALGQRGAVKLSRSVVDRLEDRVLRALKRLHAAAPRLSSVPRSRLLRTLEDLGDDALVNGLVQRLVDAKKLAADHRSVSIRGYEPKLSQNERKLKAEIARAYQGSGFAPPDSDEWGRRPGLKASTVNELLGLLRDEEILAEIGGGLFLEAEAEAEMVRRVRERLADGSTLGMSELRDLLGTTRKYAVPLGEYLDRIGLTVREGDVRRLKPAAPETHP